jgi:branched-subunit amino acid ABC-type transport system permease component
MAHFLNVAWSGIWLGSAYSALAVALVVSYRAARVVNMAVGALFIFAALLAQDLQARGLSVWLAAACAVAASMALAAAQEWLVLRRIADAPPQILLLGTLAVAIALSGVTAVLFGRDPVTGAGLAGTSPIRLGGWHTSANAAAIVAATLVVVAVLWRMFESSAAGKAITAIGVDPGAAQMLGIDVWRWRLVAMAAAGLLAGGAGALFLPLGVLDFSQGLSFTLYGFVAAAIAGYYGIAPALFAGWAFGVVSAIGTAYVSSVFSQAVTFGILAAAVLVGQRVSGRTVFT